jgi:quinol monooxygenase YgiN
VRRALIAVGICYIILGLTSPAWAEDPPPPEAAEYTPMGVGASCTALRGRPFQEVIPPYAYVSSYFSVNCQPTAGIYTITEVNADMMHRQGTGDGAWGPYSNDHALKSRNSAGTVSYQPMRDRCNTGGAMRLYQQWIDVEVAWHHQMGGQTFRYHHIYLATALNKRPCGAHEP